MAISFPDHHLEDPLSHSSLLSLLRKTAGGSLTRATNAEQQEPQSVHEFLKPMTQALSNSEKFLAQAKMILDSNSDPPKSDLLHQALSQDEGITSAVNATDHPQRRRLAMRGRKRSQFSLRPSISQSSSNVDTTSNILQLKDPEEFFLAFERSEKADRFLKKLRGEDATNLTQHHQPATTRTRRLGISGKTYSYKHPTLPDILEKHSLSKEENLEANGKFVSSQTENFSAGDVMFHTGVNNHMQEAPDMPDTSQEMETSDSEICDVTQQKDSIAMLEKSVGELLATLMSSCEDLDGGGTVSLLQEHLGVKPIDLPKLSLPSLTAPTSCFSPLEKLSSRRAEEVPGTALSALRKFVSTSNGKTTVKHQQEPENFSSPHTSPIPPNLLASISRLLKHNAKIDMQKSPSLDPPKENESSVKHSYSDGGTGITAVLSQVDISKLGTSSLNFGQCFAAANVDVISTSNSKTPIKFPKDSHNSSCPRTSPTPPRSTTALLPILQKHDPQFNNRSPKKHSPSVGHMRKQGMPLPADANKDDMGSLRFSLDPSSANIDGRRLSFEGDAQSLEGNSTLVNNSNSPKVLKDHSSCPFDGITTGDINRSSGDMDFRPDVHESKADEVEITPCKTTISQGEVPGFGSPTSKTIYGTRNLLPDQSGPTTDSCLKVDGHSENLSIPTELNNAEYQAHKVAPKRQNKRKAVQHKKDLAAATADSSFPVDGHSENLSVLAELNNKENQAPKISSQRRNKRKSVQVREILGARSSPTADSCLPVDGPSENLNISTEFNIEENWAPKVSPKKQNRRKAVRRRDSLAGAGTVWKSGVRRSTRIRTRPLEDWRGERFLYARIHDSLTTVIGLKYASPAKDGSDRTPVFKVKSYVSEEYADLVKKAAL